MPLLREWLVETDPDQVHDVRAVIDAWRPDAIATDLSLWGAVAVVPDLVPVPVALSSTFMGPLIPGPTRRRSASACARRAVRWGASPPRVTGATELAGKPLRRRLDQIRGDFGLGPLGESVNRHTARLPLYLVGNVPELDYGRHDLPPSVHYVGNCIWYPERTGEPTAGGSSGPGRPSVGARLPRVRSLRRPVSVARGGRGARQRAGRADRGRRRGDRDDRRRPVRRSAANVHVAGWLSHGELLPRCSALSPSAARRRVLAAIEAGVPMVVVPTTWDKPDNARRVTEAGAGVRLAPGAAARRPTCARPSVRCSTGPATGPPRAAGRAAARRTRPLPRRRAARGAWPARTGSAEPARSRSAEAPGERLAPRPGRRDRPGSVRPSGAGGGCPPGPGFCPTSGRWGRARRWLPPTAPPTCSTSAARSATARPRSRCGGPRGRVVIGLERDPEHLEWATAGSRGCGSSTPTPPTLPVADGCADAVMLLDVLEHIAEREPALTEARRVLRPGGVLVLTVSHGGPLRWLDADLYAACAVASWPSLPPIEAATESGGGPHRITRRAELESLRPPGSPSIASPGPRTGPTGAGDARGDRDPGPGPRAAVAGARC